MLSNRCFLHWIKFSNGLWQKNSSNSGLTYQVWKWSKLHHILEWFEKKMFPQFKYPSLFFCVHFYVLTLTLFWETLVIFKNFILSFYRKVVPIRLVLFFLFSSIFEIKSIGQISKLFKKLVFLICPYGPWAIMRKTNVFKP